MAVTAQVDEITPLLSDNQQSTEERSISSQVEPDSESNKSVFGILSVLLIGVFVSQADVFLVLATYGRITSEFNALEDGDWLLTTYVLAQSVAQPLYGKLSDIFGRKRCLQASYVLFSLGTLFSSMSQSMPQIIAARVLEGLGGAGMVCMVSILLTDLVPLHKVAVYRSYVNLVQTVGRSCGAVIGGYIAQTIGWRWGFFIQCPIVLVGLILTELRLQIAPESSDSTSKPSTTKEKLKRVDFLGAFLLSMVILSLLLFLDLGGQKLGWDHPFSILCAITAFASLLGFMAVEQWYAKEPIFPLRLVTHRAVVVSYTMLSMQTAAITAMTFVAPLYFQIIKRARPGAAGLYLLPGPVGNTLGGLLAGWWIGRTLRYKLPSVIGAIVSMAAFVCMIFLWTGKSGFPEPLFILPVGFATGIAHSASFIGLGAGVDASDIAIAASGLYLFSNIGMMTGISLGSAIYQVSLRKGLATALVEFPNKERIIKKLLGDISYAQNATGALRAAILPVYVQSFQWVFVLGLVVSSIVLVCSILSRNKKLPSAA